jgi:hypothetical protein
MPDMTFLERQLAGNTREKGAKEKYVLERFFLNNYSYDVVNK